jgi:hypothetical protein
LLAQEEEEGNVFAIMFLKIPREEMDEFINLWDKEMLAFEKQIDEILSHRVFTHWWGPDWSVMVIREFKDLASMEKSLKKIAELAEKKYPDEKERKKINNSILRYYNGHFDAIVTEVPKLRK